MKNVILGILFAAVISEGYLLWVKKPIVSAAPTQTTRKPPPLLTKGMKLAGSSMEKFAYEIAPSMTDAAKAITIGFDVKTQSLADGSLQVDLVPKDSDDQLQQYTVLPGNKLYFIEMTPSDDKPDTDRDGNYRDDYGIVTDANGIVQ